MTYFCLSTAGALRAFDNLGNSLRNFGRNRRRRIEADVLLRQSLCALLIFMLLLMFALLLFIDLILIIAADDGAGTPLLCFGPLFLNITFWGVLILLLVPLNWISILLFLYKTSGSELFLKNTRQLTWI